MPVKDGKEKWRRKTYQHATSQTKFVGMTDKYVETLEKMGIKVGPETRSRYRGGVRGDAQPGEPQRGDIAKAADKWEKNYVKSMNR